MLSPILLESKFSQLSKGNNCEHLIITFFLNSLVFTEPTTFLEGQEVTLLVITFLFFHIQMIYSRNRLEITSNLLKKV